MVLCLLYKLNIRLFLLVLRLVIRCRETGPPRYGGESDSLRLRRPLNNTKVFVKSKRVITRTIINISVILAFGILEENLIKGTTEAPYPFIYNLLK